MQRLSETRVKRATPEATGAGEGQQPSLEGTGHMRIARDGTWYHEGRPIPRKQLVKLFATVLRRDRDGAYWLQTPVEKVRIHVDDAPFIAEELETRGEGGEQVLAFRTNVDDWVEAGPAHPIRVEPAPDTGEPRPYIHVRDGLEALIARSVFYRLAELATPAASEDGTNKEQAGEATLGVWSHGTFFPLNPTPRD